MKKWLILVFMAAFFLQIQGLSAEIIYNDSFDDGDISDWVQYESVGQYEVKVNTDTFISSPYSMRLNDNLNAVGARAIANHSLNKNINTNDDFNLTFDMYVSGVSAPNTHFYFGLNNNSNNELHNIFKLQNNRLYFLNGSTFVELANYPVTSPTWVNIEISNTGGDYYCYVNETEYCYVNNYTFPPLVTNNISFSTADIDTSMTAHIDNLIISEFSSNYTFLFYDEITKSLIDNITYSILSGSNIDRSTNVSQEFSTSNGSANHILNDGDHQIVYSSDGYYQRDYYITANDNDNTINLYLLNKTADNVAEINYLVTNEAGVPLDGARVKALRRYIEDGNTVFNVVEMSESDNGGEGAFHLQKVIATYQFLVTYNGNTVLTTGANQIFENSIILRASTSEDVTESLYWIQGLTHSITYDNNTESFTLTWDDSVGLVEEMCFYVNNYRGTGKTTVNSSCSTSTTGSLELGTGGGYGQFEAVAIVDTTTDYSTHIVEVLSKKIDSIKTDIGVDGIFWAALFVIVGGTIAYFSPVVSIILAITGFVFVVILGVASISLGVIMFVIAIGGFILYALRRGGG